MSLIALPSIRRVEKPQRKHRAADRIAVVEQDNRELRTKLAAAERCIEGMRIKVSEANDARDKANAKACRVDEAEAKAERSQRDVRRLEASLRAWEAHYANQHRVTVPAPRDLHGGVQPLWNRPVTDPGDPGWEDE